MPQIDFVATLGKTHLMVDSNHTWCGVIIRKKLVREIQGRATFPDRFDCKSCIRSYNSWFRVIHHLVEVKT